MKQSQLKRSRHLLFVVLSAIILVLAVAGLKKPTSAAPALFQTFTVEFDEDDVTQSVDEGDSGTAEITFTVEVAGTFAANDNTVITVGYRVLDSTTNSTDYNVPNYNPTTGGTLSFDRNNTSRGITIEVIGDTTFEDDEDLLIVLQDITNATLGNDSTATLVIENDDPDPNTSATATPGVFVDEYEPNDSLTEAYVTAAGATEVQLCDATLWPTGDTDYYQFVGKAGSIYKIRTFNLEPGLDTRLTAYDTEGDRITDNDDIGVTTRASEVAIIADKDGFYYARVDNQSPADATNLTYCIGIQELAEFVTPTPTVPFEGGDECEFNSTRETACEIGIGESIQGLTFEPVLGSSQDTDFYRLWMKPNITYTCETFIVTSITDTNMIFLDQNGNDFQPNLGNDDKEPGDLGSKLSYRSTYTGWLYILIGPVNPPAVEDSSGHVYDLQCTAEAATPTPTPTATRPPTTTGSGTGTGTGTGGGVVVVTPTPFEFPTPLPTATPIDFSILNTPTPAPPPVVVFNPLPTATPISGGQQLASANVTVYYDGNGNFTPELTEGVMDVAVALYDNATGNLLAFGYTNEAGMIRFDNIATSGAFRIVVPYLNYSQVAANNNANILVRIAPQPLPIGIP